MLLTRDLVEGFKKERKLNSLPIFPARKPEAHRQAEEEDGEKTASGGETPCKRDAVCAELHGEPILGRSHIPTTRKPKKQTEQLFCESICQVFFGESGLTSTEKGKLTSGHLKSRKQGRYTLLQQH